MNHLLLSALALLILAPAFAQPSLVFSKEDLPELRERVKEGDNAPVWAAIKSRADQACDPSSPRFADPEQLDAPPTGEIRIQVLGHYFGRNLTNWVEDLGFAYQITGDEKYGRQGAKILMTAVEKIPVTDPRLAKSFAGARGDIAHGLATGYDWLGELLTEDQKKQWAEVAAGYVRNILAQAAAESTWWVPHHNFMGVAGGAAGCLALQLREFYPEQADAWVDQAAQIIDTWFTEGFDEQGAYYEGTGYSAYGLSNATLFAEALLRSGGRNLFTHPRLAMVPHFYAMSILPGERVVEARNDANYSGLSQPFLPLLARRLSSPLMQWVWERCGGGTHPFQIVWQADVAPAGPIASKEPLSEHFQGRGLCVFLTGWEKEHVMFSVEAGPYYPVTHNQADKGSFTLYGLGQRWAIDSGYGNNREPGGRDQTVAHNSVLIDGQGQAISGAGAGTNGKILQFSDGPDFGHCLADATEAYNRNNHNQPGAVVRHALRHSVFLRPHGGVPACAVVFDDIDKDDQPHEYTWLLHTSPNLEIETGDHRAVLTPGSSSGGAYVHTPADAAGRGCAEWKVTIEREADYAIWARVRAGGAEGGKSDSFIVQVDGGQQVHWHMPTRRDWTWGCVGEGIPPVPMSYHLPAGRHTIRFFTREPEAHVDQVAIVGQASQAQPPFFSDGPAMLLEAEDAVVSAPMEIVSEEGADAPPRMVLRLNAAAPVTMHVDGYDGHPRLNAVATAANPKFAAVLIPLPGGVDEPDVSFAQSDDGITVNIDWAGGASDSILFPTDPEAAPVVGRTPGE